MLMFSRTNLQYILFAFFIDIWLDLGSWVQCWEGYFGNVIGYRLQVTLLKM